MSHVENVLQKCYDLVKTIEKQMSGEQDLYTMTPGKQLLQDITSALQIVKHEAVQCPLDVKEAALMKTVAQMYLGEITIP